MQGSRPERPSGREDGERGRLRPQPLFQRAAKGAQSLRGAAWIGCAGSRAVGSGGCGGCGQRVQPRLLSYAARCAARGMIAGTQPTHRRPD